MYKSRWVKCLCTDRWTFEILVLEQGDLPRSTGVLLKQDLAIVDGFFNCWIHAHRSSAVEITTFFKRFQHAFALGPAKETYIFKKQDAKYGCLHVGKQPELKLAIICDNKGISRSTTESIPDLNKLWLLNIFLEHSFVQKNLKHVLF